MGRRNDHSRGEIRAMALDAATNLLASAGPEGLSARKIASEIGYTVGTLYLVFDNLDDLVMQMNLRTLKQMRAQILEATDESQSPQEQLKAIAAAYIYFARQHEHPWRMIYEHRLPEKSDKLEEYKEVSRSLFIRIEQILGQIISTDAAGISMHAQALWGGVHGICILSLAGKLDQRGQTSLGAITDLLIERFIAGNRE